MLKKLGIVCQRFGQIWLYVPRYEIIHVSSSSYIFGYSLKTKPRNLAMLFSSLQLIKNLHNHIIFKFIIYLFVEISLAEKKGWSKQNIMKSMGVHVPDKVSLRNLCDFSRVSQNFWMGSTKHDSIPQWFSFHVEVWVSPRELVHCTFKRLIGGKNMPDEKYNYNLWNMSGEDDYVL